MPRHIPVRGLVSHTLVHKSELGIVGNKPVLTGQDKTLAALFPRVSNSLAKQLTRIPMLAICRQRIDTENHLPRTVLIVHGGILVHLISQVGVIGHEPVHEGDEFVTIIHQPEMIAIMGNSLGKLGGSSSLSGRKTLGLNGRKCGNIIRNSVSNRHGRRCTSQRFSEIISIQQSLSMVPSISWLGNAFAKHIAFELGLLKAIDPTLQTVVGFVDGVCIVICGSGKHVDVTELIVGLVQRIQTVEQRLHLPAHLIIVDRCSEDNNLGFLDLCHDFGYIILQYTTAGFLAGHASDAEPDIFAAQGHEFNLMPCVLRAALAFLLSITELVKNMLSKIGPVKEKEVETSLIESFLYPKYGPGQLWEHVADEITKMGGSIRFGSSVQSVSVQNGKVTEIQYRDAEGQSISVEGDIFISSMPVKDLIAGMGDSAPEDVHRIADGLPYRDFVTVGILTDKLNLKNETAIKTFNDQVPDCWIYVQDTGVKLGRIQVFNNWSPYMVKDVEHTVWLGLEYFCTEGDSFWTMSDEETERFAADELVRMGIINAPEEVKDSHVERVKKAYPAYFDTYGSLADNWKECYNAIKAYLDEHGDLPLKEASITLPTGSQSHWWIRNQTLMLHQGRQNEDKVKLLNEIGIV